MTEEKVLEKLKALRERLRETRRENVDRRLALLYDTHREIWRDAECFMHDADNVPWQHDGDGRTRATRLVEKYQVPSADYRPAVPQVSVTTALFCEACELMAEAYQVG